MRKITSLFFAVTLLTMLYAQDFSPTIAPLYTGPNWGTIVDTGITCTGGPNLSVVRDDGTYENGYQAIVTGDSSSFVQKMVLPGNPFTITQICVVWTRTAAGTVNRIHDLIVYDTLGAGGAPGNLIARIVGVTSNNIAIYPLHTRHSFTVNIPGLTNRAYYVGVRLNNNPTQQAYFSADENGTNQGPGYWRTTTTYPAVWEALPNATFATWRNFGIRLEGTIQTATLLPDLLYYKFEQNVNATTVRNCAVPGVGTPTAPIAGTTITTGGQYDSCLTGAGATSSGVTTGWNTNFGSGSWTISFWVDLPTTTFGYLFGDGTGSFRCFNNGAAGTNGLTLRGTGITNVDLTGFASGPVVVTYVYDSAMAQIRAYKNGVLSATVSQTPLNLSVGAGFRVGGYTTVAGYTGKLDEFRVYRRALTPAEITATWNIDLGGCGLVGVTQNGSEVPSLYSLSQNYPNPFNPTTNIKFSIPSTGLVKLVIFDVLGREVATLVNEVKTAGNYVADFDASHLSSGVYFYRIESNDFVQTKKMLLVK